MGNGFEQRRSCVLALLDKNNGKPDSCTARPPLSADAHPFVLYSRLNEIKHGALHTANAEAHLQVWLQTSLCKAFNVC